MTTIATSMFDNISNMEKIDVLPGVKANFISAEKLTIAYWYIDKGGIIPQHAHHHEQVVNCMSGEFEMTIGDETKVMTAGEVAIVPANVTHSAKALTQVHCIDIFTPVREDYMALLK